jgi:hypothetical protein
LRKLICAIRWDERPLVHNQCNFASKGGGQYPAEFVKPAPRWAGRVIETRGVIAVCKRKDLLARSEETLRC